ncbi:hypothetical protein LZL87_014262 [Fusarium oxysporum]|nr:hypothetical protein LZL87_014262 [Fusarium oxysporum]
MYITAKSHLLLYNACSSSEISLPMAAIHSAPYHEALRRESGVLRGILKGGNFFAESFDIALGVPHLSGILQTQGKHLDRQIDHGDDARRDAERVCH